MLDIALQELIEFIKNASPIIWQALYRQVYVDAAQNISWALALSVLAVVFFKMAKWATKKKEQDGIWSDWEILIGLGYFFGGIAAIAAFGVFVVSISRFANPDFYAIRYILQIVTGTG